MRRVFALWLSIASLSACVAEPEPDAPVEFRTCEGEPATEELLIDEGTEPEWVDENTIRVDDGVSAEGITIACDCGPNFSCGPVCTLRQPAPDRLTCSGFCWKKLGVGDVDCPGCGFRVVPKPLEPELP